MAHIDFPYSGKGLFLMMVIARNRNGLVIPWFQSRCTERHFGWGSRFSSLRKCARALPCTFNEEELQLLFGKWRKSRLSIPRIEHSLILSTFKSVLQPWSSGSAAKLGANMSMWPQPLWERHLYLDVRCLAGSHPAGVHNGYYCTHKNLSPDALKMVHHVPGF